MKRIGVLILLLGLAGGSGCSCSRRSEATQAAIAAAETWLKTVDDGRYDDSWESAADFFKAAVTKEQWIRQMELFRAPLGSSLSRKRRSGRYRNELPGAPDGDYVVIQFRSSFASKKSAIETLTPMREKDGVWRVAGYLIK